MRRIIIVTIIFSIILSLLLAGCIFKSESNKNENRGYQLYYEINLRIDGIINYTVNIPLPIGWNTFFDDLSFYKGNANYSITETTFGKSLQIKGDENVQIIAKQLFDPHPNISISLLNVTNMNVKIYCNKNPDFGNISLLWSFSESSLDEKSGGYGYKLNDDLENGWQEINVKSISIGG